MVADTGEGIALAKFCAKTAVAKREMKPRSVKKSCACQFRVWFVLKWHLAQLCFVRCIHVLYTGASESPFVDLRPPAAGLMKSALTAAAPGDCLAFHRLRGFVTESFSGSQGDG